MTTDTITIWYNYNVKWKDTIQWKKKATGKLILNTFGWKLSVVITEKRIKCLFKGDRGGRVDDFGTQGVVKVRSLVKNGKLFDVSSTERQTIQMRVSCMIRRISFCNVTLQSNFKGRVRFWWEYMNKPRCMSWNFKISRFLKIGSVCA